MADLTIYNQEGAKVGEAKLSAVFDAKMNYDLVHQVVLAQKANQRKIIAHTKTRGEVSGGGRKPWAQKGTGRARHGSIRSPLWKGGGVAFGPRNTKVYKQKVNEKMRKLALLQLLSRKAKDNLLIALDTIVMEKPKTKILKLMVAKLPLQNARTLLVLSKNEKAVVLASRNIPKFETRNVQDLNVLDVVSAKFIILQKDTIPLLEKKFA